jgi:hypothetical protein
MEVTGGSLRKKHIVASGIWCTLFLVLFGLSGIVSAAKGPLITVDPFARGVIAGNLDATFENCVNTYINNQPTIPYEWTEWGCDDLVGYLFTLRYTDRNGNVTSRKATVGEKTNARTELDQYYYEQSFTETDQWGESSTYSESYFLVVYGWLRCKDPDLPISPDKSILSVGDRTKVSLSLRCGDENMEVETLNLTLTGPGKLASTTLITDTSGKADTVYHATENGSATITAKWTPTNTWRCEEYTKETEVCVGVCGSIDLIRELESTMYGIIMHIRVSGRIPFHVSSDGGPQEIKGEGKLQFKTTSVDAGGQKLDESGSAGCVIRGWLTDGRTGSAVLTVNWIETWTPIESTQIVTTPDGDRVAMPSPHGLLSHSALVPRTQLEFPFKNDHEIEIPFSKPASVFRGSSKYILHVSN